MTLREKIEWILNKHNSTNHFYDTYLPYEFHLRMVVQVFKNFQKVIENSYNDGDIEDIIESIELSCWGHDLIEDTRTSYNEIKQVLGIQVADIIYALTNEKGKDRAERANDKYYEGIRNTEYAVFIKLCDRIANVQYSKMSGSLMFAKYKKENINFIVKLGWAEQKKHLYEDLFNYLNDLFKTEI